jgi:2-dehydropantoate 2-reductase
VVANGLHQLDVHLGLLYGGALLKPGLLKTGTGNQLVIGPLPGVADRAGAIARQLNCPWLLVGGKEEIVIRMWHKLALNCVVNPLTVMLDCLNGQLPLYAQYPLIQGILAEVVAVARAEMGESWPHTVTSLFRDLEALVHRTAANSSSMREDLRNGRETEISKLNQAVVERGQLHGIECATNSYLCDMVSILANK